MAALRIGEVARRTGVAVTTLRAWERRHGLLDPQRTDGGHRRYGLGDVERVQQMQALLAKGWGADAAAAEARRLVAAAPEPAPERDRRDFHGAERTVAELADATRRFDGATISELVGDTFEHFDVAEALDLVLMPWIRHVGDGWEDDPGAIAREHFASNAVRVRLLRLLRRRHRVTEGHLVAVAPEHEDHDLGVLATSTVAVDAGWRATFLGARTPTAALRGLLAETVPDVVLVGAVGRSAARRFLDDVQDEPLDCRLVLGGAGFMPEDLSRLPAGTVLHEGNYRELAATLAG